MNRLLRFVTPTLAFMLCVMAGCAGEPLSGPPDLRLGRSECGECGMIISEDRCSSGLLVERDGRRHYLLYDDIGCMLDDEREGLDGGKAIERYVHDHATRAWLRVEAASFLFADDHKALATPMGSGIIAFAARAEAELARVKHPGRVLAYSELGETRRAWMEERYGKPRSAGGSGTGH